MESKSHGQGNMVMFGRRKPTGVLGKAPTLLTCKMAWQKQKKTQGRWLWGDSGENIRDKLAQRKAQGAQEHPEAHKNCVR